MPYTRASYRDRDIARIANALRVPGAPSLAEEVTTATLWKWLAAKLDEPYDASENGDRDDAWDRIFDEVTMLRAAEKSIAGSVQVVAEVLR